MEQLLEAILFMKGEPVTKKELVALARASREEVDVALEALVRSLESRGIRLIQKDDEVMLATSPEFGEFFRELAKEEQSKDLGKAGLETLAIVLYHGPVSKNRIEYIRGVNSSFVLRGLLIRGLIERVLNPEDQRSYLYRPTFDALAHLGVSSVKDLPDYGEMVREINAVTVSDPEKSLLPEEDEFHEGE